MRALYPILVPILLSSAASALAAPETIAESFLGALRCPKEVNDTLDGWGALKTETKPGTPVFADKLPRLITMPGRELGAWVEIENRSDGEIRAYRTTSRSTVVARWPKGTCVATIQVATRELDEKRMSKSFTDDDLRELVARGTGGILYAWSPEMPHSMRGLTSVRKAAAQLGLPLTVLLDPQADDSQARAALKASGEPSVSLRKIESSELLSRSFTMHFPTVMVYSKERVVGRIYPGLGSEKAYADFIKESLR